MPKKRKIEAQQPNSTTTTESSASVQNSALHSDLRTLRRVNDPKISLAYIEATPKQAYTRAQQISNLYTTHSNATRFKLLRNKKTLICFIENPYSGSPENQPDSQANYDQHLCYFVMALTRKYKLESGMTLLNQIPVAKDEEEKAILQAFYGNDHLNQSTLENTTLPESQVQEGSSSLIAAPLDELKEAKEQYSDSSESSNDDLSLASPLPFSLKRFLSYSDSQPPVFPSEEEWFKELNRPLEEALNEPTFTFNFNQVIHPLAPGYCSPLPKTPQSTFNLPALTRQLSWPSLFAPLNSPLPKSPLTQDDFFQLPGIFSRQNSNS